METCFFEQWMQRHLWPYTTILHVLVHSLSHWVQLERWMLIGFIGLNTFTMKMILLLKDEGPKPHSKESEKWWNFVNNKLNMKRISCTMGHVILPCFHNCHLILDASVVNIEQLDQKQYWMERMVDNASQTGLRVGSLNQCWMVIGNRNRPPAVIRVALGVHDQGSQETQK